VVVNASPTIWLVTIGFVAALLVMDFVVAARRPHAVGFREAVGWSVFYIGVAVAFGVLLWAASGSTAGAEYFAGWVVEKSLSVDNLFVFVIIMGAFSVPKEYQQKVLLFGIAVALVMRGIFIAIGAAAISLFSWTFVLFGAFLIYTAVQLARHRDEDPEISDNPALRFARRRIPSTEDMHGGRVFARENGRRVATPLFFVFLLIGTTDLLFALDSIPAVFGVTQDPYIVFTANAFALLGLRALYFLISNLLQRLVYLSLGLAVILAFIGVKLILAFLHDDVNESIPHVPTSVSLGVILGILVITTVASLLRTKRHPEERAHAGDPYGGDHKRAETGDAAKDGMSH
jgi:tellurite resistance protein TerC